jgi:predicted RNase H-like HicB family nuclease
MTTYFVIVHEDRGSAVGVVFPDLPGCFSAGDTLDEAIDNAHEALRLYAEAEHSAGRNLPEPRTFRELYHDREVREEAKGAPFIGFQLRTESEAPRTVGARRSAKSTPQAAEKRKKRATS